ncbi:MAG: hypothetical protein ACJ0RM_06425 [Alphaproteobacteria bacterium]
MISIKEARLKKGLSIAELASSLKLDIKLVQLLDDDAEVPDKYKAYMSSYKRSIFNYLGYKIPFTNHFQESQYDYSKFLLTSFFLIFSIVILFFSSFNIYNKFNNQVGIKNFEKDKIYEDTLNFISKNNLENINYKDFIDLLVPLKRTNYSQTFVIQTNNLGPIYYKIKYIDKKTILFGELLQLNKIELDLNNDFLIDLSNIANIDKIIYRGIEINLKNNYKFYLKDFNINELETLL